MELTKSKIFLYLCLSFIIGVAIASFVFIPYLYSGIFLIAAIVLIVLFWPSSARRGQASEGELADNILLNKNSEQKKWKTVVLGFCIIFTIIGIWQFQRKSEMPDNVIGFLNNRGRVVLIGIIGEEPEARPENQRMVVQIAEIGGIVGSNKTASGKVLVVANKYPRYEYGDKLKITGYLKAPENFTTESGAEFDYKSYLAKNDIYSITYYPEIELTEKSLGNSVKNFLYKIKSALEKSLTKAMPEPQASLAKGLILGERATIPKELTEIFNIVGLTHIVALSGFNITIIAEAIRRVFNWLMLRKIFSFWLTIIFIITFVLMTGASASIVRAGIMGILIVLARKEGRLYNIRNALIFAGAVMIWFNPKILRLDLGFHLSFMATLGLVYISPVVEKYFQWLPKKFALREIGIATIAAQAAVLPLVLFSFGRLSLISPIINLLVLPFIPAAMFWSFLGGATGIFWNFAGNIFAWLAWIILTYQIKISELAAKIPIAAVNLKIGWIWAALLYAGLWGVVVKIQMTKSKCQFNDQNLKSKI